MPRSKHLVVVIAIVIAALILIVSIFFSQGSTMGSRTNSDISYIEGKDGVMVVEESETRDLSIRESLLAKLRLKKDEPEEVTQTIAEAETAPEETEEETSDESEEGRIIGDGRISKNPQAGYIFACESTFNGGGAVADVPWIEGSVWYANKKTVVDGAASWPNSASFELANGKRVVVSNGFPNHSTGAFPISPSDDAYAFDRNPNMIQEQNVLLELPLEPVRALAPSCLPLGMIGAALNGVAIFNGLDGAGRDAVAHEVQDVCEGHPERSGEYHYHGESDCLVNSFFEGANSTLLGYALDGYGIFSSVENGVEVTNNELDACHGHEHVIPWNGELKSFYHYHMTDAYPYTLGCFTGTPVEVQGEVVLPPPGPRGTEGNQHPPQGSGMPPLPPPGV